VDRIEARRASAGISPFATMPYSASSGEEGSSLLGNASNERHLTLK
jgi:hypothetical protein